MTLTCDTFLGNEEIIYEENKWKDVTMEQEEEMAEAGDKEEKIREL